MSFRDISRIAWQQPVNWEHPLSKGMIAWWLAAPGRSGYGSSRWRDMCGRYNLSLTNMDPVTDWSVGRLQGSSGALDFDGSNDYAQATPAIAFSAPFTISITLSGWNYNSSLFRFPLGFGHSSGGNALLGFDLQSQAVDYFVRGTDGTGPSGFGNITGLNDGRLLQITGVSSAANRHELWINGVMRASSSTSAGTVTTNRATIGALGRDSISLNWQGKIHSASAWLAAIDPAELHKQSRRYYPDLLNRYPTRHYFVPGGGGGGTPSGTGNISAIASLSGVGKANKSGSGSVSAVASLSGIGAVVKSGSGSIAAVASISGVGKSVRSGAGSITAIASLSGVGSAPALTPSGTGSISAIASLGGIGSVVTSGLGSIAAVASISGIGKASHSGTGSISAVASLSGIGSAPVLSGPPINLSAPVLTVTEGSWSLNFGTWDDQGLGPLTYSYTLVYVDELNNSTPIAADSGLPGPGTSYSGTPGEFDNGRYYALVEAENTAEETDDVLSNDFYLTPPSGSGSIVAIGSLSGVGAAAYSGLGSIAAIASISGVGKTHKSGTGSISAVASLSGVGRSSSGSPVIEYYYRYLLAT